MRRFAALALVLSGCATTTIWAHQDPAKNNDQHLSRDFGECQAQAAQATAPLHTQAALNPYLSGALATAIEHQRELCLVGRGWRKLNE